MRAMHSLNLLIECIIFIWNAFDWDNLLFTRGGTYFDLPKPCFTGAFSWSQKTFSGSMLIVNQQWHFSFVNMVSNEAKSVAGNHWLRLSPSVALLRGRVSSSLGIRCQQQQLVD